MERNKTQKVDVNARAGRTALALTVDELKNVNGGGVIIIEGPTVPTRTIDRGLLSQDLPIPQQP